MPPTPLPTGRPFTIEEAARLGHSRRALQGRQFQILYPRVYASAGVEITAKILTQAALLATPPGCAASHHSGLSLYGIDVGTDLTPHLSTLDREPIRVRGVTVHRLAMMRDRDIDGWRALSPELCLSTAATRLSLVDLVIAADALYHRRLITPGGLKHFLNHHHGAGVRRARRAQHLSRARSESPRETYVRLMLELAGLPPLECNRSYGDEAAFVARLDLSWSRWKIAIEYDGRQHGLDLMQRERDVQRREQMERLGWVFIVVTAAQLRRPREIVLRVCDVLRSRQGWAPLPHFSGEWSELFD